MQFPDPRVVCAAPKKSYTIYYNNISHAHTHTHTHTCVRRYYIIILNVCRSAGRGAGEGAWRWRLFGNSSRSGPSVRHYERVRQQYVILLDVSMMIVFGVIIIIVVTRPRDRI